MKSPYSSKQDFFSGALSAFDIGSILHDSHVASFTQGLGLDMQQLLKDQDTLETDYKKACDRMVKHLSEDFHE